MNDNKHILIVDDNRSIHEDIKKILLSAKSINSEAIDDLEEVLFDEKHSRDNNENLDDIFYEIDDAFHGEEALQMVEMAENEERPYALIFMDVRMPPGMNGIETISKIWERYPYTKMIICSAYSDYSWDDIILKLGSTDRLLILKKPFATIEVKQITSALITKWNLSSQAWFYEKELKNKVKEQTEIIHSMLEFANKLNSLGNLNDIMDCILETVSNYTDSERLSIMLMDEDKKYLTINKSIGLEQYVEKTTRIKIGDGIAGNVFESGEMMIVNDLLKEGLNKKFSDYDAFISAPFICVPLAGPKVKLGVMNITNKKGNQKFTEEDADIISYISYTASIAINNQLNEMKLEESFLGTIKSLAEAIEAKDPYTRGHSDRVSKISEQIAKEMGLSNDEIKILNFAGILHDIGKIGIPESVLSKPGKLTSDEFELIKKHPEIGETILRDIKFLDKARDIIRHHHERIDGSGYPDGIKGETLCVEARIVAIADTFDAMNSDRPYRKDIPVETVREELIKLGGKSLDADCVNAFLGYLEKNKQLYG